MGIEEVFQKGGLVMWPLLALSILSIGIIVERLWFWIGLLSAKQIGDRLLEAASSNDWEIASEMAQRSLKQPIGRLLYAPLRLSKPEPEVFKLALEAAADEELASMRRGDKFLEAIIALAPLLGFLGTVLGLMKLLNDIRTGNVGTSSTDKITLGISEALIATASGLIVAIVTLAFYRLFQAFLSNQAKVFRKFGNELELIYRQKWPNIGSKLVVDRDNEDNSDHLDNLHNPDEPNNPDNPDDPERRDFFVLPEN